jgi:cytochrome c oxidase cbb3-type subunit 3
MRNRRLIVLFAVAALAAAFPAACKREERGFRVQPPSADRANGISQSTLRPGLAGGVPETGNEYEENAFAVSEGQNLYEQYNCVGCHSHGGGGIGPPLMDAKWIYGSDPANVFATIVEGRPNGMPSFRGKIPDYQVWELVAFVRSMSGLVPKDVPPPRTDDLHEKSSPQPPPGAAKQASQSKSAEAPQ